MEEFLKRIESFLAETGMPPSTLGWRAVRNPSFVFGLRKGKGCTVLSMKKVEDFMNKNKISYEKTDFYSDENGEEKA